MNTAKKAYIVVDTSHDQGALALLSGSIIFSRVLEEKFSHGKFLCAALKLAQKSAAEHGYQVSGVLCGLGPGSFVGIRIALATMLGFCFARSLPLMGFCSHLALAYSLERPPPRFYLYMKASGSLGYLTRCDAVGAQIEASATTVVSIAELAPMVKGTAIFSNLAEEIAKVLPREIDIVALGGPTPLGIARASLHRLRTAGSSSSLIDESRFIKPNYIKPPNVSTPKNVSYYSAVAP